MIQHVVKQQTDISSSLYQSPATPIAVELFTHPICNGCQEAVNELSKLDHEQIISLEITSLSTTSGRGRAQELSVTSVPTVRIGDEFVVLMHKNDLETILSRLTGGNSHK